MHEKRDEGSDRFKVPDGWLYMLSFDEEDRSDPAARENVPSCDHYVRLDTAIANISWFLFVEPVIDIA